MSLSNSITNNILNISHSSSTSETRYFARCTLHMGFAARLINVTINTQETVIYELASIGSSTISNVRNRHRAMDKNIHGLHQVKMF